MERRAANSPRNAGLSDRRVAMEGNAATQSTSRSSKTTDNQAKKLEQFLRNFEFGFIFIR
jgi:hypothetical protein